MPTEMRMRPASRALLTIAALAACATSPPSGTDGAATPATPAAARHDGHAIPPLSSVPSVPASAARPRLVDADIRFMSSMIGHHAQALEMTALVRARTRRPDFLLLAERIEVSQRDEIALMKRWLEKNAPGRGGAPGPHGDAAHHHMPGMLSAEEIAGLSRTIGAEFESRFLSLMIRHHEGALVMVGELIASPGAAQNSEIFRFAADVEADQLAEIQRMRGMLGRMQPPQ